MGFEAAKFRTVCQSGPKVVQHPQLLPSEEKGFSNLGELLWGKIRELRGRTPHPHLLL